MITKGLSHVDLVRRQKTEVADSAIEHRRRKDGLFGRETQFLPPPFLSHPSIPRARGLLDHRRVGQQLQSRPHGGRRRGVGNDLQQFQRVFIFVSNKLSRALGWDFRRYDFDSPLGSSWEDRARERRAEREENRQKLFLRRLQRRRPKNEPMRARKNRSDPRQTRSD